MNKEQQKIYDKLPLGIQLTYKTLLDMFEETSYLTEIIEDFGLQVIHHLDYKNDQISTLLEKVERARKERNELQKEVESFK